MSLTGLPKDILTVCLPLFLGHKGIAALSATCKYLHSLLHSLPILSKWKDLFLTKFPNTCLQMAAKAGFDDMVGLAISKGSNDWKNGLYGACEGGHMHLLQFFIAKGANHWNWGLYSASKGGQLHIVKFLIEKGANNWDWGLHYAIRGGNTNLVEFFKNKMKI
jgi:hypothetical protein